MLFSGSKEHGKTRNRQTNVLCVWMIWSGTTGWALKSDSYNSKALDRTSVVLQQPTLDAVIEGRNSGIKEWEFQERAGMGQEML
jgi:hypothetical protein